MSLAQTRDSSALRAHLDANQPQKPTKTVTLPQMNDTIKNWSKTQTIAKTLKKPHEDTKVLVPADPYLSNTALQALPSLAKNVPLVGRVPSAKLPEVLGQAIRKDQQSLIEKFSFHQQEQQQFIVQQFTDYVNQLIAATYQDLSQIRQNIQYKLGDFETLYKQLVSDVEKKPLELIKAIQEVNDEQMNYLASVQAQFKAILQALTEGVQISTREAALALDKNNLTPQQISQTLKTPTSLVNEQLQTIVNMLDNLVRSTTERMKSSKEDFIAQTTRVMANRRARAANQLVKDFAQFVEQNEWGQLCGQINNVNCAHQQISSNLYDQIQQINSGERESAVKIAQCFLNSKTVAVQQLQDLLTTHQQINDSLRQAAAETTQALGAIAMPGHLEVEQFLQGWEQRWAKRIGVMQTQSSQVLAANAFYVAGLVVLIANLEFQNLKIQSADAKLQKYFSQIVQAIEERFARDQLMYNQTIGQIDESFKNMWNAEDALKMSKIADTLINAMGRSMDQRYKLLVRFAADQGSDFQKVLKDLVMEQLGEFGAILSAQQLTWEGQKSEKSVQYLNELKVPMFDDLIFERQKDQKQPVDATEAKPESVASQRPRTATSAKTEQQKTPRKDPKSKAAPAKDKKFNKNEQGLYAKLPNFEEDMNLDEYRKTQCFNFGDLTGADQLRDAMLALADPKAKKGKDEVLGAKWIEPGANDLSVAEEAQKVNMKVMKDSRIIINYLILKFMQKEGQRMAYNKAVADFEEKIKTWRVDYLKILNEVAQSEFQVQQDQYNKDLKEFEKKQKIKKTEDQPPIQPIKPQEITQLPEFEEQLIKNVKIPQQEQLDQSNVYMRLVYQIISYEDLKHLPDFDKAFSVPVADIVFADKEEKPKEPKASSPVKKDVKRPESQNTTRIAVAAPPIKEFWVDSRIVQHAQSQILQTAFSNIYVAELQKCLQKFAQLSQHYLREGDIIRRRVSSDVANYQLTLQHHRTKYVQQSVLHIETRFAERNAATQRQLDQISRVQHSIAQQFLAPDCRFTFSKEKMEESQGARQGSAQTKVEKMEKEKQPPKQDKNQKVGIETMMQQKKLSQILKIQQSPTTGQITQIEFLDLFGQQHPIFRLCSEFFEEFNKELQKGYQTPHLLPRQLLYARDRFISLCNKKMQILFRNKVINPIFNLQKELDKLIEQGKHWGTEVKYDFSFADTVIDNLECAYGKVRQQESFRVQSQHPCVQIYQMQKVQTEMFLEECKTRWQHDIVSFKILINHIQEISKVGNALQIAQNEKKIIAQRETGKLTTLIIGRLITINDNLSKIELNFAKADSLFKQKETEVEDKTQAKKSFKTVKSYQLENNQVQSVSQFIKDSMELENLFYLLGYDKDIKNIVQKVVSKVTPVHEQFQQRLKGFNCYFALLFALVYSIDKLAFRQDHLEILKEIQQQVNKYQPVKQYQTQKRIYLDQQQVDLTTQFQTEFNIMISKFPQCQITKQKPFAECVTEQDWLNYYVFEMSDRLQAEYTISLMKCKEVLQKREQVMNLMLTNLQLYFHEFHANQIKIDSQKEMQSLQIIKTKYIDEFNKLYDQYRPILLKMPEKIKELQQSSQKIYESASQQFTKQFSDKMNQFCHQLLVFNSLLNTVPTLFSFYPTIQQSINCSLQLNQLVELQCKDEKQKKQDPPKDKEKDKKPEKEFGTNQQFKCQNLILEEPLTDKEDSFIYYFQKILKSIVQASTLQQQLFNIQQIPEKELATAPALKSAPYLVQPVCSSLKQIPNNTIAQPNSTTQSSNLNGQQSQLPNQRQAERPQSQNKKQIELIQLLPIQLTSLSLQISDQLTINEFSKFLECKLLQQTQILSSFDAQSCKFATENANLGFKFADQIVKTVAEFYLGGCGMAEVVEKVKMEFDAVMGKEEKVVEEVKPKKK